MSFKAINENTYVCDDGHVRFFLLTGEKEALLIDSGMQVTNAKELAEEITDKPLKLFNTHADRDHTASNCEFDRVMMNPAEFVNYRQDHPSQKMVPVYDGDVIDLGGRQLKAIVLPGHTPGSTALLDLGSGMLFSGDPIQRGGRIYMFGAMRDMSAYILSLKRLMSLGEDIKEIYPSHGEYPLTMDIVPELIAGAERVERGEITPTRTEFFGNTIDECDIGIDVLLCDVRAENK